MKEALLHTSIAGNELWRIGLLFAILLLAMLGGRILKFLLNRQAKAMAENRPILSSGYRGIGRAAPFLFLTIGLQTGLQFLHLGSAEGFVGTIAAILFTIAVACVAYFVAEVPTQWLAYRAAKTEGKLDDMLAPIIGNCLRITIVVLAVVQVAQIISGKEITSILAGLGIGGLAVALAAQDTLRNFFGSIVLLVDKPFEIGERINIDGHDGPVESVGLRSTRIRTLEGHLVSIPNGELANKAIWNIARRPHIRRIFNIGITYETPLEKVHEAKAIMEDV
ncbi:MAG: mechanosensitive ion channel family protein, partial [Coraliomargarita sp.]